ncbi:MAG: CotH kinase family protein [Verrucomicrobiales bacterium]|nr:CotH kinase family protein [Verrucomicrobiales bacterium]
MRIRSPVAVRWWRACLLCFVLRAALGSSPGAVVLNELMYHPPDDRDELQWIELHNASTNAVDLAGWSFQKGVTYTFPSPTRLAPGGFAVIASHREAFLRHYGTSVPVVLGSFQGRLSHSGETLELVDASGAVMDSFRYGDSAPWPVSPDGLSASLERIAILHPTTAPENWAPSVLPSSERAAGSPGRTNAAAAPGLAPVITDLNAGPWRSGHPLDLSARVTSAEVPASVVLAYQAIPLDAPPEAARAATSAPWTEIAMRTTGTGLYTASLPPLPGNHLLRARVIARSARGLERIHPHPHDARPTLSLYLGANTNSAQIPFVSIHEFGPREPRGTSTQDHFRNQGRRRDAQAVPAPPARGSAVVLYLPPKGAPVQVFDHVRVTPRKGGWKLRFHKDRMLESMSTVNVLFEEQPRHVLSEHLSFELFREAGVASPLSGHWRIWHNGQPLGYHLYVEQVNGSFLRRNRKDDAGDLFKILWYEQGVAAQHEKKNNADHDHHALEELVRQLRATRGDAQWELIQRHFNVDACVNYYAVNMCLQNWDGFFNNHFVYQAPAPDGRWEIFPWDEDKTWGDYDGASASYDWYTMPLTFGMTGDPPKQWSQWWRPGGWFSAPLLANAQFRARFKARLKELCQTVFTLDHLDVAITRLERRLEPEVAYRATLASAPASYGPRRFRLPIAIPGLGGGPIDSTTEFKEHIESFRRQVKQRREFLLNELASGK